MRETRERSVAIPLALSEKSFLLEGTAKSCRSHTRSLAEAFSEAGVPSPLHLTDHLLAELCYGIGCRELFGDSNCKLAGKQHQIHRNSNLVLEQ